MANMSDMVCAACGYHGVTLRPVTRTFGSRKNLLVIEDIPLVSCPRCDESYFSATTMHEIERIKLLRKSVAVNRKIPVADYPKRA